VTESAEYRGASEQTHPAAPTAPYSPTPPARPSAGSRFKKIWIGRNGLRAGWAALLFFMITIGLVAAGGFVLHHLFHHPAPGSEAMTPGHTIVGECMTVGAVLIATKVMSLFDKKSWLDYGLRAPRRVAHLLQGVVCGVILLSGMMGLLLLTHGVTIEFSAIGTLAVIKSGLLWAVAFALVALFEELVCRGYAFFTLASGTNAFIAAILLSLLFGSAHGHNAGESPAGLIAAGLFGMVISLSVWRTGSLWWALGFHAAWDWSESFVFGANDSGQVASSTWMLSHAAGPAWLSGGSVGPEGSMMIFPVLIVLTLVIMLTLPRNPARWVRRERQLA